jgi:hypothetical protein
MVAENMTADSIDIEDILAPPTSTGIQRLWKRSKIELEW